MPESSFELHERLQHVFRLVVEDVIETGEPVGSHRLVEVYGLEVSPATIRSWLSELESQGLLMHPHTSAGRVPTEEGYRYYLDELMREASIRQRERTMLEHASRALKDDLARIKAFARLTSEITGEAAFASQDAVLAYPTGLAHLFAQPEFQDSGRMQSLGKHLDELEERLRPFARHSFVEPTVLLGRHCPFGEGCATVLMTVERGLMLGVFGPLRMDYRRSIGLMRAIREMAEE